MKTQLYRNGLWGLIFILNLFYVNVSGQENDWLDKDFPGSTFINLITKDGNLYGAVSTGPIFGNAPNNIYHLTLYKIDVNIEDNTLHLEEEVTLPFDSNYATINVDFIPETRVWILAQSSYISPFRFVYRILLLDEYFNYIDSQLIDTTGLPNFFYIDTYGGNSFILGTLGFPPGDNLVFLRYSHSTPTHLPPIKIGQSTPKPTFLVSSMVCDSLSGNMLIFTYDGISLLDTNLNQIHAWDYQEINTMTHGYVVGNSKNYFSHGVTLQSNNLRWLVYQVYDSLFNILFADTLGINGQDNYPFIIKSIDYDKGELLIGGHLDGPLTHSDFSTRKKKFYLAKYDYLMHPLWYHEYGGDKAYMMLGVKIIENNKNLAYGYIADSINHEWHAYILLVGANGELLATHDLLNKKEPNIHITNSGQEILQIDNPDGFCFNFKLFNISGNLILDQEITNTTTLIQTFYLPVGIYPYQVVQNNNILLTSTWIKY